MDIKVILTTIAASAVLFGCNQVDKVSTPPNETGNLISSKWGNAVNTSNPFEDDSSGYIHNEAMEYLLSESKGYSEDKFVDSINIMIKDFIINYVGDTPIQDQMSIVDSFVSYYENNDTIDDDLFDPIFQDHFNSTALEQIDTLNSILQGNYSSYSQLKDDLVEWEQDVDSLSNISGDQERALLNGGNVARYSSLFWDTYNPNDYKTNHKIGGPANPDANGFINGFIIGTSLGYSVFESIIIGIMVGAVCSALYAPEPPIV